MAVQGLLRPFPEGARHIILEYAVVGSPTFVQNDHHLVPMHMLNNLLQYKLNENYTFQILSYGFTLQRIQL
jgi:hypothetical protein